MRVLQSCAEIFPVLKTGGLADVTGALPRALAAQGCEVRTVLPGFAAVLEALVDPVELPLPSLLLQPLGPRPRLLYGHLRGTDCPSYVVDAPDFFLRAGGPYDDQHHQAYADNHLRFALFGWVTAQIALGADPLWQPSLVHAHDWHAGLVPAYLRAAEEQFHRSVPPCVFSIHNLAYRGIFDATSFAALGLPAHFFNVDGLEFHGQISFMKAGLYFADHLITVSPSYAQEIQSPEQGHGLDGLLRTRARQLSGILNGVDDAIWNPAKDAYLNTGYSAQRLAGKRRCKQALQEELGFGTDLDIPLFCIVSRLTEQKGLHLILEALPALRQLGARIAVLGSGDAGLEHAFRWAAERHPESVAAHIGYDEAFAHRLIAGADVILVPSRFEPCGLTQLYGLKYGTLPLVRKVGGLADTVLDARLETLDRDATGFVFEAFSADALLQATQRVLALYRRPSEWKMLQKRGMNRASGWENAAQHYVEIYRQLAA